jgi:hypothetical protein
MTSNRTWSDIHNAVMDEPLERHLRTELRHANDLALELGRLRNQRAAMAAQAPPAAGAPIDMYELSIHETEYLAALREGIEDLGGRLDIAAVFPDQRITLALEPCIDDETAGEQS